MTDYAAMTVQELVVAAKKNDALAFTALVKRVSPRVMKSLKRHAKSRDTRKDALQEALIVVWQKLATLKDESRFCSFLTMVARTSSSTSSTTRSRAARSAPPRTRAIPWIRSPPIA